VDCWTSSVSDHYLGISAHWISNDWKLKSTLIEFVDTQGESEGKNIAAPFWKALIQFKLESKVSLFLL
jgi:hypothetical protein